PALEVEDIKQQTGLFVCGYKDEENPWTKMQTTIKNKGWQATSWAIETNFLTVERYQALQDVFPQAQFSCDITAKIQQMMMLKSQDEITKMIEAGKWADYALEVGFAAVKEGVTEAEIVAQIEYELKKKGIRQMSFDTLVLA